MKHEVFKRGLLGVFSIGLILILSGIANAQYWAQSYSGKYWDRAYSIQQTSDGGYIVAGLTWSFGAGGYDFWVLKLDANGNIEWQKTYGGTGRDEAYSIQQTSDGGYIVAGMTWSFGAGGYDFWVLKLDGSGNVEWQKTYGGTDWDRAYSIQQTSDGGYIVAGETSSFGAGSYDVWVLKLDGSGNIEWQKTYGGTYLDRAYSIQQTSDGGYIVAGEISSFGAGDGVWVLKLDGSGEIPDCVPMGTSSATVQNTTVTGSDTNIFGADSSATVTTPSPTVNDTNVQPAQQCAAYDLPITYDLSITKAGTGSGTVTSNPAGINCGNDCTESYSSDTTVTLTATPADANSTFTGWSGDCSTCGNNTTCQVTMDADKTCTAVFDLVSSNNPPTIDSFATDVTSGTAPLTVNFTCSASDSDGSVVEYRFDFNGDGTPDETGNTTGTTNHTYQNAGTYNATCTAVDDDGATTTSTPVTITVTSPVQQYTLTVNKSGTGSGTVTGNPSGIDCGATCSALYDEGTTVTLTATPDTNSIFAGWSGDCSTCGNNTTCQVTMDADKTCTATFNAVASNAKNGTSGGGCSFTPYKSNPTMLILIIILLSVLFIRRARLL